MNFQQKVSNYIEENNLETNPEHRMLDLVSELGEASKEILKMTNYGKKKLEYSEEIKHELGDVFFSLIALANHFNIDLEESLSKALEKYDDRMTDGDPSSNG